MSKEPLRRASQLLDRLALRYREVARIGQKINQELSTADTLFQTLLEHAQSILDISRLFQLIVYQSNENTFDSYSYEQSRTSILQNRPLTAVDRHAMESGETLFVPDLNSREDPLPFQSASSEQTKPQGSLIFTPLILHDHFLGALSIQHPQPYIYTEDDRSILELLTNHIALTLYNIHLRDSFTMLNETGMVLTGQLDSEQVLQAIVNKICETTRADNVILYPYEPDTRRFVVPPRVGGVLFDPIPLYTRALQPHGIAVKALEYGQPIFAEKGETLYTMLRGNLQVEEANFQQREKLSSTAAIPLKVGEIAVGVLFINYRLPQYFDPSLQFLIEGLAHYAAIALKNARTFYTAMQRRIQELEILREIDHELSLPVQLGEVLETILRLGHEHIRVEEAVIMLYDPRTRLLETRAARGRKEELDKASIISLDESKGITAWAVTNKKLARVGNVHDSPWRERYIEAFTGIQSELDAPLLYEGEVIGVLNFESTRVHAFDYEDELFVSALAEQAVLAINKSQAYEREKRLAEEGRVLNEISREITSQLDLDHVFKVILDNALELTTSTTGTLMLYEHNLMRMAAEQGVTKDNKHQSHQLDQGVVGYVARHKRALNIDPSQPPWSNFFLSYIPGTRSELAVPMLAGEKLVGVLNVESKESNHFKEHDERLLTALADMACVALQNARAYEREKRLADESQVLYDVSQEIASQFDSKNVFDLILQKSLDLTHALTGSLYLYYPDTDNLYRVAENEERQVALEGERYQRLDTGIVGYAASSKTFCNVEDTMRPPWNTIFFERVPGVRSELAVPMLEGTDLRGVINVESLEVGHFKESDIRLLQGLAALAVVALQNSERYQKAEREAQHFKLLYRAGHELSRMVEWDQLDQAYDSVVQIAEEHSQCQVSLRHFDETRNVLTLVRANYDWEPHLGVLELHEGLDGLVARERVSQLVHDILQPPEGVEIKVSHVSIRSQAVTPIEFKDRYYGNLALEHEDTGHFHETDLHFFEGLAKQLASTIYRLETIKNRQELEQMSSIGQSAFEVTHRLDNDLGLVGLYIDDIQTELQAHGFKSDLVDQRLTDILQSARAVLSFSSDLKKEFAKLGDQEERGTPEYLIPQALLTEAINAASIPANVQVSIEVEADIVKVQAVHTQVADILLNLVTNAIQAMPEGGKLALKALTTEHYVALEVMDTGIGIPQQKQKHIFELFFSTKHSSGFGLWSARRNALKNQGDLRVRSVPGKGTTFTLLLPRVDE